MEMESIGEIINRLGTEKIIQAGSTVDSFSPEPFGDPNCEHCHGEGFVYINKNTVTHCDCRKKMFAENMRRAMLLSCGFPSGCDHMTMENYKVQAEARQGYMAAMEMAAAPGNTKWLAFTGTNDTGKTHLGIAICRKWVAAGIPARYTLTSLLLDELREGFRVKDGEGYTQKFKYYCTVPLLMLDDLGVESATDWVQEKLDTIVDYRLVNNLSLIVTTNQSLDEMQPRIRSRLIRRGKIYNMGTQEFSLRNRK